MTTAEKKHLRRLHGIVEDAWQSRKRTAEAVRLAGARQDRAHAAVERALRRQENAERIHAVAIRRLCRAEHAAGMHAGRHIVGCASCVAGTEG